MITVNTNPTSLLTQSNLNKTTSDLATNINRLSSGYRINAAKDDPAGYSVAAPLQAQIKGLYQANQNALEATNVTTVAENTLGVIQDNLTRIQQVATQSANGVYTKQQRQNLQGEVDQLTQEISRMAKTTSYNSMPLFSSRKEQFTFQIGANADGKKNKEARSNVGRTVNSTGKRPPSLKKMTGESVRKAAPRPGSNASNSITYSMTMLAKTDRNKTGLLSKATKTAANLVSPSKYLAMVPVLGKNAKAKQAAKQEPKGLTAFNKNVNATKTLNITTQSSARKVIQDIGKDINTVTRSRSNVGALANRLGYVQRSNDALSQAYQSSYGNIMDANYASESASYAANQIKQQAGAAVLAQANAMPQIALTLLR